jgi:hypothetical protein
MLNMRLDLPAPPTDFPDRCRVVVDQVSTLAALIPFRIGSMRTASGSSRSSAITWSTAGSSEAD